MRKQDSVDLLNTQTYDAIDFQSKKTHYSEQTHDFQNMQTHDSDLLNESTYEAVNFQTKQTHYSVDLLDVKMCN